VVLILVVVAVEAATTTSKPTMQMVVFRCYCLMECRNNFGFGVFKWKRHKINTCNNWLGWFTPFHSSRYLCWILLFSTKFPAGFRNIDSVSIISAIGCSNGNSSGSHIRSGTVRPDIGIINVCCCWSHNELLQYLNSTWHQGDFKLTEARYRKVAFDGQHILCTFIFII
jgi:hypothetical protein